MVERPQRRKPLVLASTQALLDSLPGDRPPPPPQEPVRLRAGVLRFPSGGGAEFGELATFVALPAPALRRLAVVTGTPVRPTCFDSGQDTIVCCELRSPCGKIRSVRGFVEEATLAAFRRKFGSRGIGLLIELEG